MKILRFIPLSVLLPLWLSAQAAPSPRSTALRFDHVVDFSLAGRSDIHEGSLRLGRISSTQVRARSVMSVPVDEQNQFLAGVAVQWLEFDPPATSLVPSTLTAVAARLGWNHTTATPWTFRAEVDPGVYGAGSFGAPVALRAIYASSRELQWAIGLNYDWRSGHPLIGGVGVRWNFAPDWTLSLLLPAPRLEWTISPRLSLFAGATLQGGTFRVADNFGRTRGRPAFDGQTVDYREITLAAGLRWQVSPATTLHLGVGATTDRRFEFPDRDLLLNGDGAPAVQLTFTSAY
jgi:hypothetical protein